MFTKEKLVRNIFEKYQMYICIMIYNVQIVLDRKIHFKTPYDHILVGVKGDQIYYNLRRNHKYVTAKSKLL